MTNINLYGRPDLFRFFEPKPQPVTVREFQVLEATSVFAGEGTLDQIAAYLSPRLGPESFGIAFVTLLKLETRDLVTCYWSDPVECDKRVYDLTDEGRRALRRARAEGNRLAIAPSY